MNLFSAAPEEKMGKKVYLEAMAYLLVTAVSVAAFCLIGNLFLYIPLFIIASFSFAMANFRAGQSIGLIFLLAMSIALFFFTDKLWFLFMCLSLFFPAGFSLSLCLSFKKGLNSSVAASFFSTCAFLVAIICVYTFEKTGSLAFEEALTPLFGTLKDIIGKSYEALMLSGYDAALNISKDEYVSFVLSEITYIGPVFFSMAIIISSVIIQKLLKAAYGKIYGKDEQTLFFFGKLRYFRMSLVGAWFFVIASIVFFVVDDKSMLSYALDIFVSVMSYLFAFEGLALLVSFLSLKQVKKPIIVIVWIVGLLVCSVPYGLLTEIFSLVGLMDAFYNFRRLFSGKGGQRL